MNVVMKFVFLKTQAANSLSVCRLGPTSAAPGPWPPLSPSSPALPSRFNAVPIFLVQIIHCKNGAPQQLYGSSSVAPARRRSKTFHNQKMFSNIDKYHLKY